MLTKVDYWGLNFTLDFRSKVLTSLFYKIGWERESPLASIAGWKATQALLSAVIY